MCNNQIERKKRDIRREYIIDSNFKNSFKVYSYNSKPCDMSWILIKGIPNVYKDDDYSDPYTLLFSSLYGIESRIAFIIQHDKDYVNIYLGVNVEMISTLVSVLNGLWQGIEIKPVEEPGVKGRYGGLMVGQPGFVKAKKNTNIAAIIQALWGTSFCLGGIFDAVPENMINNIINYLTGEYNKESINYRQTIDKHTLGNSSYSFEDESILDYLNINRELKEMFLAGQASGMWRGNIYISTDNESAVHRLFNISKSMLSSSDSKINIFNLYDFNDAANLMNRGLPAYFNEIHNDETDYNSSVEMFVSSNNLANILKFPEKEFPGFFIDELLTFDTAARGVIGDKSIEPGTIRFDMARQFTEMPSYKIYINDLTRHGLIVGMTGSGKTTTSKKILTEIWERYNIPFLVIEPAKKEYHTLSEQLKAEELNIFTVVASKDGNLVLKLNPFDVTKGILVQTHIDYIMSTFSASFSMYPPMPFVLESSVYSIYKDYGYEPEYIANGSEIYWPTLTDLYYKVEETVSSMGYTDRLSGDIIASLQVRINSLRIGAKGILLNNNTSIPIESLMIKPTIIELEDVGDDDAKAFILALILTKIYEYYKNRNENREILNVILIEEAHRLLSNVSQNDPDKNASKAKAVEFFVNMLAEIRAYGQGFLIADQIPTKLTPELLKNTNLKVCHRLTDKNEREAMGKAMNMTDSQIESIATFKTGFAAIHSEGDIRPKLVKINKLNNSDTNKMSCSEKANNYLKMINSPINTVNDNAMLCATCKNKCLYKKQAVEFINSLNIDSSDYEKYFTNGIFKTMVFDKWRGLNRNYKKKEFLECVLKIAVLRSDYTDKRDIYYKLKKQFIKSNAKNYK